MLLSSCCDTVSVTLSVAFRKVWNATGTGNAAAPSSLITQSRRRIIQLRRWQVHVHSFCRRILNMLTNSLLFPISLLCSSSPPPVHCQTFSYLIWRSNTFSNPSRQIILISDIRSQIRPVCFDLTALTCWLIAERRNHSHAPLVVRSDECLSVMLRGIISYAAVCRLRVCMCCEAALCLSTMCDLQKRREHHR